MVILPFLEAFSEKALFGSDEPVDVKNVPKNDVSLREVEII